MKYIELIKFDRTEGCLFFESVPANDEVGKKYKNVDAFRYYSVDENTGKRMESAKATYIGTAYTVEDLRKKSLGLSEKDEKDFISQLNQCGCNKMVKTHLGNWLIVVPGEKVISPEEAFK